MKDPLEYPEEKIEGYVQGGNIHGEKYAIWRWQNKKHYVIISHGQATGNWYVKFANPYSHTPRSFVTKAEAVAYANALRELWEAEEKHEAEKEEPPAICEPLTFEQYQETVASFGRNKKHPVEIIPNACTRCCGTGKEPYPEHSY